MTEAQHGVNTEAAEPYQSLYRRFRPQRFSEILGQDHVSLALRHAVRDERVSHAYLFSGPRGTGKTSTARILAKALNCEATVDGEPCDVCESCRSIRLGSSFDVHELDAASNNGVEPMRDLVARAALATPGRWKVYIVDEVHMLSAAASNALLKTLEEPPGHVVFVLATTDPQKVLPTIRSRTQHFEFHLLSEDILEGLLADVARRADLALPEGAVAVATRRGRGSARDALSVLDQVAASGVADDDEDLVIRLLDALADRDVAAGLTAIDASIRQGRDPQQLGIELVEHLRAGFLALVTGTGAHPRLGEVIERIGTVASVRTMELVGQAIVQMRDAPEPRVTLEVALIRCLHPDADDSPLAFLERLERIERRVEELAAGAPARATTPTPPDAPPAAETVPATEVAAPAEHSAPVERPRPSASVQAPTGDNEPIAVTSEDEPTPAGADDVPRGPAGARLALGAFARRGPEAETSAAPAPSAPPPSRTAPAPPAPASAPLAAAAPAPLPELPASPQSTTAMPDRDALVAAWGDHLLAALRPRPRAFYQVGRFVGVEGDVAVFALPNSVHVEHAEPLREEVAAALSTHFGTTIRLRLVADSADGAPIAVTADEEPDEELVREVLAAPPEEVPESKTVEREGVAWAETRLLEAFPGAELESQ